MSRKELKQCNRNLIAALAVMALLIVAATTAGCTTNTTPTPTPIPATQTTVGNNTTFSSAAGFNITYPKTLKTDNSSDASTPVRVYIYLSPNETADGVLVAAKSLSSSQTLSDFANNEVAQLKNNNTTGNYKNFTLLNDTNLTFAGKPARTIVWSGVVPVQYTQANATNKTVKEMQTYVVNNNMGYVITYKTCLLYTSDAADE